MIGGRLRKGWMVVVGFVVMGLATVFLGLTQNVLIALVAAFVIGVFNLVYVIPTQTLFAELTPAGLHGPRGRLPFQPGVRGDDLAMAVSSVAAERPGGHGHRGVRLTDDPGWHRWRPAAGSARSEMRKALVALVLWTGLAAGSLLPGPVAPIYLWIGSIRKFARV